MMLKEVWDYSEGRKREIDYGWSSKCSDGYRNSYTPKLKAIHDGKRSIEQCSVLKAIIFCNTRTVGEETETEQSCYNSDVKERKKQYFEELSEP